MIWGDWREEWGVGIARVRENGFDCQGCGVRATVSLMWGFVFRFFLAV